MSECEELFGVTHWRKYEKDAISLTKEINKLRKVAMSQGWEKVQPASVLLIEGL